MDVLDRLRIDVPVLQAGMGGGVSGAALAGAVAAAGGLGTLGLASPATLRAGIANVRDQAPGRAVAVNLLMPFVRRRHLDVCLEGQPVDVAVLFFGGDAALVRRLHDGGVLVMAQVGTEEEALQAVGWGVDALIAQGLEAGGHLLGREPALAFLGRALAVAGERPVFVAGGIATAADTSAALAAGAAGVVAGTRFLLTRESDAHPVYKQRVLAAQQTFETTLFGLGWPARHRVIANAATDRWRRADGSLRRLPGLLNAASAPVGRVITDPMIAALPRLQRARLPMLSPTPPLAGMPAATVENTPLYAGESALRIDSIIPAAEAVDLLAGRDPGQRRPKAS
jgi:nitronate monooxygenase